MDKDGYEHLFGPLPSSAASGGSQPQADGYEHLLGPVPATQPQSQYPSPSLGTGVFNALQSGLTFGFDDEIAAGAKSLAGYDYHTEVERMRADKEAFAREHPYVAVGAEMLGGLPTLAVPGLGAAKALQSAKAAKTLSAITKEGTKLGAKYGAVSGAGHAQSAEDAGLMEMAGDRTGGAIGGAIVGAASVPVPARPSALRAGRSARRSISHATSAKQENSKAPLLPERERSRASCSRTAPVRRHRGGGYPATEPARTRCPRTRSRRCCALTARRLPSA